LIIKKKLIIINKKGRWHKSVCQIKIALCCEAFNGVKNYSKMVGLYRKKVGRQVHKSRLQNVLLDNADRWQGRQCVNRSGWQFSPSSFICDSVCRQLALGSPMYTVIPFLLDCVVATLCIPTSVLLSIFLLNYRY